MNLQPQERPQLVGIGKDPGLLDKAANEVSRPFHVEKAGRFLSQRDPEGRALLREGRFCFE